MHLVVPEGNFILDKGAEKFILPGKGGYLCDTGIDEIVLGMIVPGSPDNVVAGANGKMVLEIQVKGVPLLIDKVLFPVGGIIIELEGKI